MSQKRAYNCDNNSSSKDFLEQYESNRGVGHPFYATLWILNFSKKKTLHDYQITGIIQKLSYDGLINPKIRIKDDGKYKLPYSPSLVRILNDAEKAGFIKKGHHSIIYTITEDGIMKIKELDEKNEAAKFILNKFKNTVKLFQDLDEKKVLLKILELLDYD